MIDDFKGGIAIVTGGASGLGEATANILTNAGMTAVILDRQVEAGQAQAKRLGGHFIETDVSDTDSVAIAMEKIANLGTTRVLVNCAGIAGAAKTVSRGQSHDPELFQRTIQVNLIGTFHCSSQAAVLMADSDPVNTDGARGVIVNTASVAAFEGQVGQLAYSASKGGIVAMTIPMARDLADKGIRVCAIAPGLFSTPLLQGMSDEVQASLGAQVPFPSRLGDSTEYASMVRTIVDNSMLNGEVIRLDGAIRMAPR